MNKDNQKPPVISGSNEAGDGRPALAVSAQPAGPTGNALQRAATVLKRLKVPAPVAAGVLAEHGLTRTAMVDPAEFEANVTAWLTAPASK